MQQSAKPAKASPANSITSGSTSLPRLSPSFPRSNQGTPPSNPSLPFPPRSLEIQEAVELASDLIDSTRLLRQSNYLREDVQLYPEGPVQNLTIPRNFSVVSSPIGSVHSEFSGSSSLGGLSAAQNRIENRLKKTRADVVRLEGNVEKLSESIKQHSQLTAELKVSVEKQALPTISTEIGLTQEVAQSSGAGPSLPPFASMGFQISQSTANRQESQMVQAIAPSHLTSESPTFPSPGPFQTFLFNWMVVGGIILLNDGVRRVLTLVFLGDQHLHQVKNNELLAKMVESNLLLNEKVDELSRRISALEMQVQGESEIDLE